MSRGCGEDDTTTTTDWLLLVAVVMVLTAVIVSIVVREGNKNAEPPAQAEAPLDGEQR